MSEGLGKIWDQAHNEFLKWSANAPDSISYWKARHQKEWLELMIPRVREYSRENIGVVEIPNPAFHGSPYHGTQQFDPTLGQGLGIWFQEDLIDAAHFAIARCRFLDMDALTPTVYEATIAPRKTAIFPTEVDAYKMSIIFPEDDSEVKIHAPFDLHEVRKILKSVGFDSIYLQDRRTISAIDESIITIHMEHKALPLVQDGQEREANARMPRNKPKGFPIK